MTPDDVLSVSAKVRLDATVGPLTMFIQYRDSAGTIHSNSPVTTFSTNASPSTGTRFVTEGNVVPSGAAFASVRVRLSSGDDGSAWFNQVMFTRTDTSLDFDDDRTFALRDFGLLDLPDHADLWIKSIEHLITAEKWMVTFGFRDGSTVAAPTFVPSPQTGAGGKTIGQLLRPVGEITMYGAATIPAGWLKCDGSTFSSDTYPDLAAVLGDTFGTHSGTTYFLPNFTDRFPIGAGTKAIGTSGGNATVTLTSGNLPPHAHSMNHNHTISTRDTGPGSQTNRVTSSGGAGGTDDANTAPNSYSGNTGNGPGSSTPVDVLNPWRSINFIIRAV